MASSPPPPADGTTPVRTIDSFAPILPAEVAVALGANATSNGSSEADVASSPGDITKSEFAAVGSFLFAALNILFDAYPRLDELGLIAGMPSLGGGRAADASSRRHVLADEPELRAFHEANPTPAVFLSLQAANSSPPFIVLESSKLGISFWAVPFLVKHAQAAFHQARSRVKGLTQEDILTQARSPAPAGTIHLHTAMIQCTRVLLLVNADHYTAWNLRKLLLSAGPLSEATADAPATFMLSPSTELRLLNLIYSKHPKSSESWNHRRWVLSFIEGFDSRYHFMAQQDRLHANRAKHAIAAVSAGLDFDTAQTAPDGAPVSLYQTTLFQREIRMCERSAELYPKNYYAWMHRQWMVERIDSCADLLSEVERAGEWTESHINDYCGFFHRQVCWYHLLALLAQITPKSKGDHAAKAHTHLAHRLRSWSKKYPLAADQMPTPLPTAAAAADAAVPAAAPVPPVAPAGAVDSLLHGALAVCSFCSAFSSTEWSHLNELQLRYPGHESLWMYRRFVWHATITAFQQHDTTSQPTATEPPAIPAWLQPLIHRELEYAEFQIADRELANAEANRTFATVYKCWVLHSALTLVYLAYDRRPQAPDESPISFPLFSRLSAQHRAWYLRLLQGVAQLKPQIMSHQHWEQRTQALADTMK